mmetsp:Transcript_9372/g.20187  ORF Transcript_9372/g.20187 Transcript_9372/m.20187 type:complete len:240 (+) Transcript_9372:47-766(+)
MASIYNQLVEDLEKVASAVEQGYDYMVGAAKQQRGDEMPSPMTDEQHMLFEEDGEDFMEDEFGSPLMGMADNVMSDIMSTQVGPQTPREHIQAFAAAITWEEPFVKCLLAFHVAVVLLAITLSRNGANMYLRLGFMIVIGAIVRLSEYLNGIGARRWRDFATQNYFDRGGIFMGIMVCAPLLVTCAGMLFSLIREASYLLVDVKKMKLQQKQRAQSRGKKTKQGKGGSSGKKKSSKKDN